MALDTETGVEEAPEIAEQEAAPRRGSIQAAERRQLDRERRKRERGRFMTVAAVVAVVSLGVGLALAHWLWG